MEINMNRYGLDTCNIYDLELEAKDTIEAMHKIEDNLQNSSLYDIAELERLNNLYISIRKRLIELRR